jgi:hypothetical protein
MGYLEKVEKNRGGYILYCSRGHYIRQSDPQNFSGGKTVVIDNDFGECPECDKEVKEAQALMGRLGIPKEDSDGTK